MIDHVNSNLKNELRLILLMYLHTKYNGSK